MKLIESRAVDPIHTLLDSTPQLQPISLKISSKMEKIPPRTKKKTGVGKAKRRTRLELNKPDDSQSFRATQLTGLAILNKGSVDDLYTVDDTEILSPTAISQTKNLKFPFKRMKSLEHSDTKKFSSKRKSSNPNLYRDIDLQLAKQKLSRMKEDEILSEIFVSLLCLC